jgi:hypothetical protein
VRKNVAGESSTLAPKARCEAAWNALSNSVAWNNSWDKNNACALSGEGESDSEDSGERREMEPRMRV